MLVDAEQVEMFIEELEIVETIQQYRQEAMQTLAKLEFDLSIQQKRAQSWTPTQFHLIAFRRWADQNVTSQRPEYRMLSSKLRKYLTLRDTSPLFGEESQES